MPAAHRKKRGKAPIDRAAGRHLTDGSLTVVTSSNRGLMRIVCENCGATFSIDDNVVTERGVRAQCPSCAHEKVVRKPATESPASAAPPPRPLATTNPLKASDIPVGSRSLSFLEPLSHLAPAPQAARVKPSPASEISNPFATGATLPTHDLLPGLGDPLPTTSRASPSAVPTSSPGWPPTAPATTPFARPSSELPSSSPFAPPPLLLAVESPEELAAIPLAAWPLSARGPTQPTGLVSFDPFAVLDLNTGTPGAGTTTAAELGPALELQRPVRGGLPLPQRAAERKAPVPGGHARDRGSSSRGRWPLALILPAGVVIAAVSMFFLRPELFEEQSNAGKNPLRSTLPAWAKQFPQTAGTAIEHVATARALMRLDSAAGHRKADAELHQALLLEVGNVSAISAWVENLASLPGVTADLDDAALAREAIDYALRREPDNIEVKRASGALRLALGEVDAAQKILVDLRRTSSDAQTLLLLAKSHLDRSPAEALTLAQQVRKQDPSLQSALVVEGAAQLRLGNLGAARDALQLCLTNDANHTGALRELAALDLHIGRAPQAVASLDKLLAAENRDVEAHLTRAKIAYQMLDTPSALAQAEGYLDDAIKNHDTSAGELLPQLLSHGAYVKIERGKLEEALQLAERAREMDGSFAPALFVLGRIYALSGLFADAIRALEHSVRVTQARDTLHEPVVRAELARVQVLAGDAEAAIRNYEQVLNQDPTYERAHFGLAAAYMQTGRATSALAVMRRAFELDPAWQADRRTLTNYPTPKGDLAALADTFKEANLPPGDESFGPFKRAAESMIRLSADQKDLAEQLARSALAEDRLNLLALLTLGVIELHNGHAPAAKEHLQLASKNVGKPHAIIQLYLARAEMDSGDIDSARARLQDLVTQEPSLVQAAYSLAMLLRQQNLEAQARDDLLKIVLKEQDYLPAKAALADRK